MTDLGRVLGMGGVAVGMGLMARPERLSAIVDPRRAPPPGWVVRVLGARQLVQGIALTVRPGRAMLTLGACIDATHATSMVALAVLDRSRRRLATCSALQAGVFAVLGAQAARANRS